MVDLWKTMNGWVYRGFDVTYKNLGVSFDSLYYESDTYLLGKTLIEEGQQKIFYIKRKMVPFGLTSQKTVQTRSFYSVQMVQQYMTQDLGTAFQRFKDNPNMSGMVYTVGNEQTIL